MIRKLLLLLLIGWSAASYQVFDDSGSLYLTYSDDGQKIFLWDTNGKLHSDLFPYVLPETAQLVVEPYFQDIDNDGQLDIALIYTDEATKLLYYIVIRQNGTLFDDKIYPKLINTLEEVQRVTINALPDPDLVSLDAKLVFNQKYNYYMDGFRHQAYDDRQPNPLSISDIYSKVPSASIVIGPADSDFDRSTVFQRQNTQERFQLFSWVNSPNTEIVLTMNYPEGAYPWRFLTYDWVNNLTDQGITFYYDHTSPTFENPSQSFTYYFSPNGDSCQDTIELTTVPSDNLYYKQTAILDVFDGPTYVSSIKHEGKTFERLNCLWNGYQADGKRVADGTYQGQFYVADGCGNISRIVTGNIFVDTVPPAVWSRQQSGSYFTPNDDGSLDTFFVTFSASESVYTTMNIYNAYGRLVRTLAEPFVWDGVDIDGVIESGTYTYELVLTDLAGNKTTTSRQEVLLDYRSPLILNAGTEKYAFNLSREDLRFTCDVLEPVNLKLYLLNAQGQKIATVNPGTDVPTGNSTFLWSGSLTDGVYNYRLLVKNRLGNTGAITGVFYVDSLPPQMSFTTFNWQLSEPATVNIADQVFGYYSAGIYAITLNGIITANAVDEAGNTVSYTVNLSDTTNAIENTKPDLSGVKVYVQALNKPEPGYIGTNLPSVNFTINFSQATQQGALQAQSITPRAIGYLSAQVLDVSGNLITQLRDQQLLPAGSQIINWQPSVNIIDGKYTCKVWASDLDNVVSSVSAAMAVIVDRTPPAITLLSPLNPKLGNCITSRRIDLALSATDNLSPVTEMQFSANGVSWNQAEAFNLIKYGFATVTADGEQIVYARVKDAAGNWSDIVSISVLIDATPPVHQTIRVNGIDGGGALTTNVDLLFIASDLHGLAPKFKLSYNDAYSWMEYVYGTTINYKLDPIAGLKKFFIKYTDALGNESGIIEDMVSLDKEPPVVTASLVTAYWTSVNTVELSVVATDNMMGVSKLEISGDGLTVTYNNIPTLNWIINSGEGTKNIMVVAIDGAGNRSNQLTINCILDTIPPQILTQNIMVENIYLPTLKNPIVINVTADEVINIFGPFGSAQGPNGQSQSISLVWDGRLGVSADSKYAKGGSVHTIAYAITDLAGNIGTTGSVTVTLNVGYELASANYDLTLPSIWATSRSIEVEYEDDPDYSNKLPAPASIYSGLRYDWAGFGNFSITYSKVSGRYFLGVKPGPDFFDEAAHCRNAYFRKISPDYIEYVPNATKYVVYRDEEWKNINGYVYFTQGNYTNHMSMVSEGNNSYAWVDIYLKKCSELSLKSSANMLSLQKTSVANRSAELYYSLEPSGNQGTLGNISNNYVVTADTKNIWLSRNGTTVNVTHYAVGSPIEVSEPSMYICKNYYGVLTTSNYNAMEDVHIVWQQKNSATDKWRIYYAVVPFFYEDFPVNGQMSMMGGVGHILAAPGIVFRSPLNGDYVSTKPKLEIDLGDNTGVVTTNGKLYLQINGTAVTYDVGAFYSVATEKLIFTLGTDAGRELGNGKNTLLIHTENPSGNAAEASIDVFVRKGLFIEKVLNYPNPFENDTTLTYMLTEASSEVKARIYTITGRLIRDLEHLPGAEGYNEYYWDGKDSSGHGLANDVYYLVILAKDGSGDWVKARSKVVKLK